MKNFIITKEYFYCYEKWIIHHPYSETISTLYLQFLPHARKRCYRFYYADGNEYKTIYADSEQDAIRQAIQIIKKKLYKEAVAHAEAANAHAEAANAAMKATGSTWQLM